MSKANFDQDEYPGRPRILFIGPGESSHTHSWIDLLAGAQFNVRLFSTSQQLPPSGWPTRTYVSSNQPNELDRSNRLSLFAQKKTSRTVHEIAARLRGRPWKPEWLRDDWLLRIVEQWNPDVIHTLGLEPAAFIFLSVRRRMREPHGKWVAQVRGGPDLALHRLLPEYERRIRAVIDACDILVADNQQNYEYAAAWGLKDHQRFPMGAVPGTGGIDVQELANSSHTMPSDRRLILWPKAYEGPQNKSLPVLEALRLAWNELPSQCEIRLLLTHPEVRMWLQTLPEEIRTRCVVTDMMPRGEVLRLMSQARVMLAPALSDGVPNSMYEAMAAGALPIVSPLDTIRAVVNEPDNVLFARNLYPHEIAGALVRAMADDELVNAAAKNNLERVRQLADREAIRPRVIQFYEQLAATRAGV